MRWARRVWRDYLELIEPTVVYEITKPSVLVMVLVACSAPALVMGYVPAVQRVTGFRAPLLMVALLALGLCFSYLLHRASAEPPAGRSWIGFLNLLDTGFIATSIVVLSAGADHPADCVLALLLVLAAVTWGLQVGFSWPMLVPAAVWPSGLMIAISRGHPLRPLIASQGVPFFVVVGLMAARRLRARREGAEEARAKLAESARLATLGQVGASLAHEMNQPLGAIRGYAERLRRAGGTSSPEALEAIALASSQLSRLVEQVGLLTAPQPSAPEPLDLATPVEDALLLLRAQLEYRGIEVVWAPPERRLPPVLGDRQRLGQLVVNLLVNARDALAATGDGAPRSVRIEVEAADGRVALTVTDSGPGVPPEVEPHLFDPFFTTKERGLGCGLGLAICRETAEQHGGTLSFERPAEGGARFRLELPARVLRGARARPTTR